MKKANNAVKTATYTAGIFIIASALLLAVLLFMCALGFIYPRKEHIAIRTASYTKIFDTKPLSGGEPILTYGELRPGHRIITVDEAVYTKVGVYQNIPEFIITDTTGANVTDMYEITADYGEIVIEGIPISVYAANKAKMYDGTPLVSDVIELLMTDTPLLEGHTFICTAQTSITEPGEMQIEPSYKIINALGADVTDQYNITESLGTLRIEPRPISVNTQAIKKYYDGMPLAEDLTYVSTGKLLPDHSMQVILDEYTEVGFYRNEPELIFTDINGNDVSGYYKVTGTYGIISIMAIPLNIETASAEKIYDGSPLSCPEWTVSGGSLLEGDTISAISNSSIATVGKIENQMQFKITDRDGNDVTDRYAINQTNGTLYISPRPLTIRTGSAAKVYDGQALICEEYEIISGSLCEGEEIELSFTSIVNIGYSENYVVALTVIQKAADGSQKDVSSCYSVTYDCGMLTVTAN